VRHQEGAEPRYPIAKVDDPFPAWLDALETRHRQNLTFAEIRRALQALSSLYVERRDKLGSGTALEGAGKRAAFALFFGPLHFLLVREIVRAVAAAEPPLRSILDLGCGTGTAGAAWALETAGRASLEGVDRSAWAVAEARWTASRLGLRARFSTGDLVRARLRPAPDAILLAFAVNELRPEARAELLERLVIAHREGARVLVVEPLARRALTFWDEWSHRFAAAGGRADEWRFSVGLPPALRLLDKAAGLDHSVLTGRSLYLRPDRMP
jgi:SAM-dependent methyltransferase